MLVQAGAHKRKPNGILGTLCRELFPWLVMHAGNLEPAYTWSSPSSLDQGDRRRRAPTRLSVDPLGTPPPLLPWIDRNTASPMGSSKLAGMDAGDEVRTCSTTRLRFIAEVDVAAWRRLDFAWCV